MWRVHPKARDKLRRRQMQLELTQLHFRNDWCHRNHASNSTLCNNIHTFQFFVTLFIWHFFFSVFISSFSRRRLGSIAACTISNLANASVMLFNWWAISLSSANGDGDCCQTWFFRSLSFARTDFRRFQCCSATRSSKGRTMLSSLGYIPRNYRDWMYKKES